MLKIPLLFIVIFVLTSCRDAGRTSVPEIYATRCLRSKADQNATFKIADCVDLEWDCVILFGPYSDPGASLEKRGIPVPANLRNHPIGYREHYHLLIFIMNGKVVAVASVAHGDLDFSFVESDSPLQKEEAVFVLSPRLQDNWPFVYQLGTEFSAAPSSD